MFSLLQFKSVIQDCPPCFSIFCSRWHINYLVHALKQHLTDIQILWQQLTLLCKKKVSHCVQATLWSLASQQIKIHNVTHELLNQCMNETATQVTTATTTKNQIKSNQIKSNQITIVLCVVCCVVWWTITFHCCSHVMFSTNTTSSITPATSSVHQSSVQTIS